MSEMKERILRTALRLFAQEGYEAVSISRIAGALGLSKGALYRHYRDKRDVLDSIVREMERRDAEGAQEYALPGAEETEAMAARRTGENEAKEGRAEGQGAGNTSGAREQEMSGGTGFSGARDGEPSERMGVPAALSGGLSDGAELSDVRDGEPSGGAEAPAVTPRQLTEYARRMVRYWTRDEFAADFRRMLTLEQYRDPEMARMLQQYLTTGPMEYTALLLENMGVSQARERAAALWGGMYLLICASDGAEEAAEYIALADAHLERMRRELERECAGIS